MALDSMRVHSSDACFVSDDVAGRAAMYSVMIENAGDIILRTDANHRRVYLSPSTREVLGFEPTELLGSTLYQSVHPHDLRMVEQRFGRIGPEHPGEDLTYRLRRKDGSYVWIEARYRYLPLDGGILGILRDISGRKQIEAELAEANARLAAANQALQEMANHDALTGLCNRRRLDALLDEEFRRARRHQLILGLAMIDIDCFKSYNDCFGHVAGDQCLRRVGRAIAGVLHRPGDHAARFGGEEFVVLLPATDEYGAMVVAERMRAAVCALGIVHRGSPYGVITVSAGVSAMQPLSHEQSPGSLLETADLALYQAKSAGRNRVFRHSSL